MGDKDNTWIDSESMGNCADNAICFNAKNVRLECKNEGHELRTEGPILASKKSGK